MIRNQRRPYLSSPQPEQNSVTVANISNMNEESLKSLIVDSLKALTNNIDDLKQSIKMMEERIEYLDSRQRKLENDFEKSAAKSRAADADLQNLHNALEALRREGSRSTYSYGTQANMDRPMMPGTGFTCVTPNYLRNRPNND